MDLQYTKYQKHKKANTEKMIEFKRKQLLIFGFKTILSVKQANDTIKHDKILSKIYDESDKDEFFQVQVRKENKMAADR